MNHRVRAKIEFDWGKDDAPLVLEIMADAYCVRRVIRQDEPDALQAELVEALRRQLATAAVDDEFFIVRGKRAE